MVLKMGRLPACFWIKDLIFWGKFTYIPQHLLTITNNHLSFFANDYFIVLEILIDHLGDL